MVALVRRLLAGLAVLPLLASVAMACAVGDSVQFVPSLQTFYSLVEAAGLDDELAGHDRCTVFAPGDEAFAALPPGSLDRLLRPENRAELARFVARHIALAPVAAAGLSGKRTSVMTLAGGLLRLDGTSGSIAVDDAEVLYSAAGPCGMVHVIDSVLLPEPVTPERDAGAFVS